MSTNPLHSAMLMVNSPKPRTLKFVGGGPSLLHLHSGLTAQSVTTGVRWISIHPKPLGSLGPFHHRRHQSRVSLRGPPCAHGVLGIPYGEVCDMVSPLTFENWLCGLQRGCGSHNRHHVCQLGKPHYHDQDGIILL
jgi:hypothetical protein